MFIEFHAVSQTIIFSRQRSQSKPTPAARIYVPTDFDTKEKALSVAKAAEKGLK